MRWVLLGDLGERHVVDSLDGALRTAGHEVVRVPSLVGATGALDADPGRERQRARMLADAGTADVLFVFRADEATPRLLEGARSRGTTTIGWFCDDPLYHGITYRHVVDGYDLTLHTARADVLAFYEQRHGRRGYAFPYWTDDAHYPYVYDAAAADVDVGFIGSFGGVRRRRWRYDLLASLPFRTRFYGPMPRGMEDVAAMGAGRLPSDEIPGVLHRFRLAVNIAQSFDEVGEDDPLFFPELAGFGEYFFPSRLIAYAAAGVPALSLHPPGFDAPLASTIAVASRAALVERARALLDDRKALETASREARAEFEACLTAASRVRMLEALLAGRSNDPIGERAALWRTFGDRPAPPLPGPSTPASAPDEPSVVLATLTDPAPAADPIRLLLLGWMEPPADALRAFARGARTLGHDVATVDLAASPELIATTRPVARGDGPVELADDALLRLAGKVRPHAVVFADGAAPSEAAAETLRSDGTAIVALRLGDPAFAGEAVSFLDRFDAVVTASAVTAQRYDGKGIRALVIEPVGEPPLGLLAASGAVAARGGVTPQGVALRSRLARVLDLGAGPAAIEVFLADAHAIPAEATAAAARGALVVTPSGSVPALAPDRELVAYESPSQLLALVAHYVRRPAEADAIRRAGLARVVREHRGTDGLASTLRELVPAPAPEDERRRVVVLGYYGNRNLGDELILDVISARLNARIDVIGFGPHVPGDHGLPGAHVLDLEAGEELVRDADALIVGGGGLLHDREFAGGASLRDVFEEPARGGMAALLARHTAHAAAHGTPVALFALGVNPIRTEAGRRVAGFLAAQASSFSVRDRASLEALRTAGVAANAVLAADPTMLLERPDPHGARAWLGDAGVGEYIAVAVRRWDAGPPDAPARIASLLDAVVERTGLRVVFVPFHVHPEGRFDEAAGRAVAERMRNPDATTHLGATERTHVAGVLAGARAVVAMRLHASILAASFGVPSLGVSYDDKVRAFFDEIGAGRFAFEPSFDPRAAARAALELIERPDEYRTSLEPAVTLLRERALRGVEALDALPAARPKPRVDRRTRDETLRRIRDEMERGRGAR